MKKKNVIMKIILALILIIEENFFYLINPKLLKISGSFNINDINLIIILIFSIYIYLNTKKSKIKINKFSKIIPIFILILIWTSSIQAKILYNQPLSLGLRPQRFLLTLLFIFPLYRLLNEYNMRDDIIRLIKNIGVIAASIYSIQFILIDKLNFLYVYRTYRFGEIRLHFESLLINIAIFIILQELLFENKRFKKNIKNIIYLIITLFYTIVVIKGRLILIGIICSIIITILISKNRYKIICIYFLLLGCIGIWGVIGYQMEDNIMYKYYNDIRDDIVNNTGNYAIREHGKKFYLEAVKNNKVLGIGYLNELYNNNMEILGIHKGYYLIDNGITAIIYLYGYLGFVIFILIFLYLLKKSWRLVKRKNNIYFSYYIFILIISQNILPLYWGNGPLILSILISLMNYDFDSVQMQE